MACVITFNNKKYSYEEFASMLHDGELGKMVLEGLIDGSKLSGDISVLQQPARESEVMSQKIASEKSSGTTQVAITVGSYVKAANIIKDIDGDVLDYGAGLGLGTDAMSTTLGRKVDSYEPNPERWQGKDKATYTSSDQINKKYDAIVSLNVLNVVPKSIRDAIVTDIFNKLNKGGKAVVSTRKWSGDVNGAKNAIPGPEEKSLIITRKQGGKDAQVFQKGFDGNELVEYVKSLLGDNADVTKNNTFGASGVVITKKEELSPSAEKPIASQGTFEGKPASFITMPEGLSIVNGWYSPIEKRLRETKIEKQSANKWLTGGLIGKGDEAIYTGVKGWLESKKPQDQVSKQEILDWMKDNRIEIVEVVLKEFEGGTAKERFDQLAELELKGRRGDYKEVLVTLPNEKTAEGLPKGFKVIPKEEYPNAWSGSSNFLIIDEDGYSVMGGETKEEVINDYKRLKGRTNLKKTKFQSDHYSEPNILVHLRMNTRTDADGNKVLFLEELQSDWGQKGKREGFAKYTEKQTEEAREEYKKLNQVPLEQRDAEWEQKKDDLEKIIFIKKGTKGVATAPFITDTNAWTKLGLKVALREAVAQGADKIAWTTGEQQIERYDLRKQVDEITYKKLDNGNYRVVVYKDGDALQRQDLKEKELESNFGKDVSEKIINDKGETDKLSGLKSLKGDDLSVGGKGMKAFYDKIVPDSAIALVKELTGQKVEVGETSIKLQPEENVVITEDEVQSFKDAGWDVEQGGDGFYYATRLLKGGKTATQQSIDITPSLKAQVEEGIPMSQRSIEVEKKGMPATSAKKNISYASTDIDEALKDRDIELGQSVASQAAPKMRQTIEDEEITTKEERKELVSNPESFQNPAVMADERKAAEDMTDDEINAVLDSIKGMEINDENPKALFSIIEAIKRATKSPDRKFMGKSIQELLPEAAKLASFAGKVLRFIQDLRTKTPELLSNTLGAMIEKYGDVKLSPEQMTELEQISKEFVSTKQAYEQAVKDFNQNPDLLNEKIKDHAYKMHEAANIKVKGLMARYTPASFYKRFIANAQGNLLVAASHGVNAVSNLSRAVTQEAPKAIVKTAFDLSQNLYYFLSQNKDLMFKLGIISGSNGLVKAINPTLYQMKNNFLYGNQAQVDASMRDAGSSIHLKTVYDWITNPNSRIRVKGKKTYVAIDNKIYEEGKLEKDALVSTESTELNAEIMAASMNQEKGEYQAFGNEVWKMKAAKHGNLVEEMPYPPAATEDQITAINLQAQKKAYEMSTVPARGMMAKSALLQISGITAEITQRLTSTMDIMFNNPQAAAILAAEAGRLKITPEKLLEFAATDKEFKQYLDNRLKSTTFQEDSALSGNIAKFEKKVRAYLDKPRNSILDKSVSSAAKLAYVAAKLSALFVKTPLNIGLQLVDVCTYGSISFAKAIASGAKIPSSTGSTKIMNEMKFRDNMAAGVVSFGLALAATAIVAAGCATGDYDSYDKKQLDIMQAAKKQLSSINLSAVQRMLNGGSTEWLETDRVVPAKYFGLLGMSIMYFAGNANKSAKSKMKAVSSGTKSRIEEKEGYFDFALDIPRIVMSQSAVSSANTVLKAVSDKESRSWPGVAKQYGQGIVAGLGMPGTVSKAIEEATVPELIDASSSTRTMMNTAKYRTLGRFYERITGYQSGLPMKVDALGRKVTSVPEGEDVTLYNLNPFQSSSYKKDPVANKLLELYEQTQDPKVVPTKYRQGTLHKTSSWDPTIDEFMVIGEDIEALNLKRGSMYYEALSSLFKGGASVYDEKIEDYRLVPYDKLTQDQKKLAVTNAIKMVNMKFEPFLNQYLESLAIRTGTSEAEIKKGLVIDGYEEPEPDSDF